MNHVKSIAISTMAVLLLTSITARADIVTFSYSGDVHSATGGSQFLSAYGGASTFEGILTYDTLNPFGILDHSVTFFDAFDNELIATGGPTISSNVHLLNAFAGSADNIYLELGYGALPAADPTSPGMFVDVALDIYDGAGNLLIADDLWPSDPIDLDGSGYQVIVSLLLSTDDLGSNAYVGELEGSVATNVPTPQGLVLFMSGLILLGLRTLRPDAGRKHIVVSQ